MAFDGGCELTLNINTMNAQQLTVLRVLMNDDTAGLERLDDMRIDADADKNATLSEHYHSASAAEDIKISDALELIESANYLVKEEPVYMAISSSESWEDTPQLNLGRMPWVYAVQIAKSVANSENRTVRLCHTAGCNNQGYYFSPEY